MKTFEAFINEANNVLYSINTNKELTKLIISILKDKDYRVESDGDNIIVYPKDNDKLNKFKDMIYSDITTKFAEGNEDIVKFVGSTKEDDLINSDIKLDVEAIYK